MTIQAGRPPTPVAAGQARAGHGRARAGPPPGAGLPRRERLGPVSGPGGPPRPDRPPAGGPGAPATWPAHPRPDRLRQARCDDTPQRWSAQLARTTGPIPQTYYDLAFGDGRLQVVLTETPGAGQDWAAGPSSANVLQLTSADTGQQGAVAWQSAGPGDADSVRLAERVLADADQQAAAIRQVAASQAVVIRETAEREAAEIKQQAAAGIAPIREAAEREAAEIKQQAAAQVAAIREAAEREIAELRATVLAMSDELKRVATYVTENLTSPGQPAVSPPRQAGPRTLATPAQPPSEADAKPSAEAEDDAPPAPPGPARPERPARQDRPVRPARPAPGWPARPAEDRRPGDQGASAQRHAPDGGRHGRADHHRDPVRGR